MTESCDLSSHVTRSLLQSGKISYALLDENFRISEAAPNLASFLRAPNAQKGASVFEALEALVGAEQILQSVLRGEEEKYQIEYLDLSPPGQPSQYISLYLCPAPAALGAGLLLIAMDMTSPALIEQRAVQARNELQLMRARLEAQNAALLRQAFYDPLTDLPNRRYFEQALPRYLSISQTSQTPCVLIMMDIDDFKAVNDSRGHQTGDEILRGLARIIAESVRKADFSARYGGDEFFIVAPFLDAAGALPVAKRIQNAFVREYAVSVSVGVADYRMEDDPGLWIQRADQAAYAAKRAGKNCVRVYREGE